MIGVLLRGGFGGRRPRRLPFRLYFNHRRLRWRRRERFDQLPPAAFRMRVDVGDDALDAFRHRRGFEVEELRARHGDVRDGLVDLEKLESMIAQTAGSASVAIGSGKYFCCSHSCASAVAIRGCANSGSAPRPPCASRPDLMMVSL